MTPPERIFGLDELPALPLSSSSPGVIALGTPGCVLPGYAGPVLGEAPGPAVHLPANSPLQLADLRGTPGVAALTVSDGAAGADTRLALALAVHLRILRGPLLGDGPVVTADSPATVPMVDGLTRVLHFATLYCAGDMDRAVWEWITPAAAVAWFGGPLPAVTRLHEHVDVLLQLRRLARAGRLASTPAGVAVVATLTDRYWSGRWLLTHHQLVEQLVDEFIASEALT